jgi:hypothetical protein
MRTSGRDPDPHSIRPMMKRVKEGSDKPAKKRAAKRKSMGRVKSARAKSKTNKPVKKKSSTKRTTQVNKKKSHKKKSRGVKNTRKTVPASKSSKRKSKRGAAHKKKAKTQHQKAKKPTRKKQRRIRKRQRPVFLAYRRVDRTLMRELRRDLIKAGIQVWTDEGLPLDTAVWTRTIDQKIKQSRCVILVLTPRTGESNHILKELDAAEDHRVAVIPIWREGRQLADVKFYQIRLMNIRNAKSKRNYRKTIRQLIELLG